MPHRSQRCDTAEVIFEDCLIPRDNLLGNEGEGFIDSLKVLDGAGSLSCAMTLGHDAA